jgi:Permeases
MLKKLFGFDPKTMSVRTEVVAGFTTFLTMCYILAVNPNIFSHLEGLGYDSRAIFTSTALAAVIGTLLMALYAKKPFVMAPGMGTNSFFVFAICLNMGYSWHFALTAILIEGVIFFLLTVTGIRMAIVEAIPKSLRSAIAPGIGLFIAFIGLQNSGLTDPSSATLVTIGDLKDPDTSLALLGLIIAAIMMILKVKGGLLWSILITTIIGVPLGITHFDGMVSTPPSVEPLFMKYDWNNVFSKDMILLVASFLSIDLFSSIGAIISVASKCGDIDEKGNPIGLKKTFTADSTAIMAGSCLGVSTTTTFVESAAGIAAGGRSGLTAFTTAVCFALAMLFSPLFLAIPNAATAPVLVIVGVFMITQIKDIDFDDYSEGIPAFITFIIMPLAYSIADGILIGIIIYVLINMLSGKWKKLNLTLYILAILIVLKYALL